MAKLIADAPKVDVDAIKAALAVLESPKAKKIRERAVHFSQLYDLIQDLLDRSVPKRAILDSLAEHGVKVTYVEFAELLKIEAQKRDESISGKGIQAAAADSVPSPKADQAKSTSQYGQAPGEGRA
ncbi:hypothetical protein [Bordetella petrii]|uniref:hypothetical protein n=1 Tax=Bordetella petrii TaxID=94624 RepID=UPI001A970512|nr:hypothetical protein [Bordetella petrii]MBO1111827.1 hypothetical protein [Bordetella petrii]